ncbi:MAG: hypothetical protein AB7W16_14320 [Candidatus Obscuribacterales bacterium]
MISLRSPKDLFVCLGLLSIVAAMTHQLHSAAGALPTYVSVMPEVSQSADAGTESPAREESDDTDKDELLLKAANGMRSVGEAIHEAKRTAHKIILELKRTRVEVPNDSVVMGPIIVPEEVDPGLPPTGEVEPARDKWMRAYVDELGRYLELLELETGRALLPAEKQSEIDPLWIKMEAEIEEARQHYLALGTLVKELKHEELPRQKFYEHAMHVVTAMDSINGLRGDIYNVCKKLSN